MFEPRLPDVVAAALGGCPAVGVPEQALPLLTTDADGQPRAMLLSRAETAPAAGGSSVHLVMRPSTSRGNTERSGLATLLVVCEDALHSVQLRRGHHVQEGALQAIAFEVVGVKEDSVGIPLIPMGFTPTKALVSLEHWQVSSALLSRLAAGTAR